MTIWQQLVCYESVNKSLQTKNIKLITKTFTMNINSKHLRLNTLKGVYMKQNKLVLLFEILTVSTKLGLSSFGGPIAHLGYFHEEYVRKRKWLDEQGYANLVALCQFLPGPASSQVGIGIGVLRGGLFGGILAFIGFTLPSVIALILFALLLQGMDIENAGWIHGLKIVAVAVVAHAISGMASKLTPDLSRKSIALFALISTLLWQTAYITDRCNPNRSRNWFYYL